MRMYEDTGINVGSSDEPILVEVDPDELSLQKNTALKNDIT